MASSAFMHVEELEYVAGAELGLAPARAKPALAPSLLIVFVFEAALFLFVAAAACRILLTPRPATISERDAKTRLVWIDKSGHSIKSLDLKGRYTSPRTFPSSAPILLNKIEPSRSSIWSLSLDDLKKPMIPMDGRTGFGILAPSGKEIVFESWSDGVMRSNIESGRFKPIRLGTEIAGLPQDWSNDGRWIALTRKRGQSEELWLFDVSTGRATMFRKARELSEPRFSPDSRWIAFAASFGGDEDIYRVAVPGTAAASRRGGELMMRISPDGGYSCRWGESVDELFYLDSDQDMVAVQLDAGTLVPTQFRKIFHLRSMTGPDYEYRFDGYGLDTLRNAFVFALARAAKREGH